MNTNIYSLFEQMPRTARRHSIEKEIRAQQNSTCPIIPWTAFTRLANEVLYEVTKRDDYTLRAEGVRALQCATEDYMINLFGEAHRLAQYTGRETVSNLDMRYCIGEEEALSRPLEMQDPVAPPSSE